MPVPSSVTAVEVRQGRGPKPPYRVVGLTTTDPVQAVREMSDAIRMGIKDIRTLGEDGYHYGIPVLDGMATCVRARLFPITQVASMMKATMAQD